MLYCMNAIRHAAPPVDPDVLLAIVLITGIVSFGGWALYALRVGLTPAAALAGELSSSSEG